MKILRDLRLSTELLILLEVVKDPHIKLKTIAEKLDITVQGASDYLRRMKNEGFIQSIGREYRATKKGIDFLHTNFSELKTFVDTKMTELNIIDVCAAIAKTPIEEGGEVGLFMENGVLTAYSGRKSNSKGTAISSAEVEEDVAIKDLDGIVTLSPGMIHIIELPSIQKGGSSSVSVDGIRKLHDRLRPQKVGVMDAVSIAVVRKAGIESHFEFAPLSSAVDAVEKGLNVMLFASSDNLHNIISTIEDINSNIEDKIVYEIVNHG
jgi:predicted transcriptional regulator